MKVKQPPEEKILSRCIVTGKVQNVDGTANRESIVIIPAKSGIYEGVFYAADTISIKPGADGVFSVSLPPSTVCGTYTFIIRGKRIQINVPDRGEVSITG